MDRVPLICVESSLLTLHRALASRAPLWRFTPKTTRLLARCGRCEPLDHPTVLRAVQQHLADPSTVAGLGSKVQVRRHLTHAFLGYPSMSRGVDLRAFIQEELLRGPSLLQPLVNHKDLFDEDDWTGAWLLAATMPTAELTDWVVDLFGLKESNSVRSWHNRHIVYFLENLCRGRNRTLALQRLLQSPDNGAALLESCRSIVASCRAGDAPLAQLCAVLATCETAQLWSLLCTTEEWAAVAAALPAGWTPLQECLMHEGFINEDLVSATLRAMMSASIPTVLQERLLQPTAKHLQKFAMQSTDVVFAEEAMGRFTASLTTLQRSLLDALLAQEEPSLNMSTVSVAGTVAYASLRRTLRGSHLPLDPKGILCSAVAKKFAESDEMKSPWPSSTVAVALRSTSSSSATLLPVGDRIVSQWLEAKLLDARTTTSLLTIATESLSTDVQTSLFVAARQHVSLGFTKSQCLELSACERLPEDLRNAFAQEAAKLPDYDQRVA